MSEGTFVGTPGKDENAPKAGTRRHAAGLPGLASKAVVRVRSAMFHRDPKQASALLSATKGIHKFAA